jgi:hypothetical protein
MNTLLEIVTRDSVVCSPRRRGDGLPSRSRISLSRQAQSIPDNLELVRCATDDAGRENHVNRGRLRRKMTTCPSGMSPLVKFGSGRVSNGHAPGRESQS